MSTAFRRLRPLAPLLMLLALALGIVAAGAWGGVTLEGLVSERARFRALALHWPGWSGLAFVGVFALMAALALPGTSILAILGGALFGWGLAAPLAILGATAGAGVLFLASRRALAAAPVPPRLAAWAARIRRDALWWMLSLRFLPILPFPLVTLGAAAAHVPLALFLGTTVVGVAPIVAAYALAGEGLDAALAACMARPGEPTCDLATLADHVMAGPLPWGLALLAALAALPLLLRRRLPPA